MVDSRLRLAACVAAVLLSSLQAPAGAGRPADPLAISPAVVTGKTVLSGNVLGGTERESAALVEYLVPGKKDQGSVGLLLGLYAGEGASRKLLWSRDYAAVSGGGAAGGTLALLDLDGDDRPEIIVTWQRRQNETIEETAEILRCAGESCEPAWSGPMRLDTSAASSVPPEKRERFFREIDLAKTVRTRGGVLYVKKTVAMAAGMAVNPVRTIEETFPLGLNVRTAP